MIVSVDSVSFLIVVVGFQHSIVLYNRIVPSDEFTIRNLPFRLTIKCQTAVNDDDDAVSPLLFPKIRGITTVGSSSGI